MIPTPDGKLFIQDLNSVSMMDIATNTIQATVNLESSTLVPLSGSTVTYAPYAGKMIVAGDGNAYVVYEYYQQTGLPPQQGFDTPYQLVDTLAALRMSPDGTFAKMQLNQTSVVDEGAIPAYAYRTSSGGFQQRASLDDPLVISMITNADTGATAFAPANTAPQTQTTLYPVTASAASSGVTLTAPFFAPVLQREDANYVGTDSLNHLVALGAAGLLWQQTVIPDGFGGALPVFPQYATSDGGIIASSTPPLSSQLGTLISVDQNGAVVGQTTDSGAVPSWHGSWYEGMASQFASVSFPTFVGARTLASYYGGNPSLNRVAARPWQFNLIWQNDFTFRPEYPTMLSSSFTVDITAQASTIKAAALKTLADDYNGVGVTVFAGTAGAGDNRATVLNSQTLTNSGDCGVTDTQHLDANFRPRESQVDYKMNMLNAQDALKVTINNSQDEAIAIARIDLMQAIGRGIGATASHELAHQYLGSCCAMDSNPLGPGSFNPDPNTADLDARGAINATGCSAKSDPSIWLGFWPTPKIDLHWEPSVERGLGRCLGDGVKNLGAGFSCAQ